MCGPGVATGCALFVAWADASALLQPICEELGWYTPDTDLGVVVHAALASQLCAPRKTSTSNGSATRGIEYGSCTCTTSPLCAAGPSSWARAAPRTLTTTTTTATATTAGMFNTVISISIITVTR